MSDQQKKKSQRFDKLVEGTKPLTAEITKLRAQMEGLGLFAGDRELQDCRKCKLEEDVTAEGLLITSRSDSLGVDTGLRFQSVDDREDWWRCPACGMEFRGEG